MDFHLLFYIGLLFLLSQIGGRIAHHFKGPRIVGYLFIGVLAGQSVFNLYPVELLDTSLTLVNDIALSIIAFSIGGALRIKQIKKLGRMILTIALVQSVFAFVLVSIAMFLYMYFYGAFLDGNRMAVSEYLPFILFLGAIAVATAPAAVLAIINENKSRGAFTTTLVGVVALDDAITMVIFGFILNINEGIIASEESWIWSRLIVEPLIPIVLAILIGATGGIISRYLLKYVLSKATLFGVSLGGVLITGGLALTMNLSLILAVMTLGFVLANFVSDSRKQFAIMKEIEEPVFGIFFMMAGAHLQLDLLLTAGLAALALSLSRFAGKYYGIRAASIIITTPKNVKKYLGLALLPQAGVAIALVFEASRTLQSEYLSQFIMTIVLASIMINAVIAPFLLKFALKKTGESHIQTSPT